MCVSPGQSSWYNCTALALSNIASEPGGIALGLGLVVWAFHIHVDLTCLYTYTCR